MFSVPRHQLCLLVNLHSTYLNRIRQKSLQWTHLKWIPIVNEQSLLLRVKRVFCGLIIYEHRWSLVSTFKLFFLRQKLFLTLLLTWRTNTCYSFLVLFFTNRNEINNRQNFVIHSELVIIVIHEQTGAHRFRFYIFVAQCALRLSILA